MSIISITTVIMCHKEAFRYFVPKWWKLTTTNHQDVLSAALCTFLRLSSLMWSLLHSFTSFLQPSVCSILPLCVLSSCGCNASGASWTLSSTSSKHRQLPSHSPLFFFCVHVPHLLLYLPFSSPFPVSSSFLQLQKAGLFLKITPIA